MADRSALIAVYDLNNGQGNPYQAWRDAGKPVYPNRQLLESMRAGQDSMPEIRLLSAADFSGTVNISMFVPLPGVTLLHICQQSAMQPPQVRRGIWEELYTALHERLKIDKGAL